MSKKILKIKAGVRYYQDAEVNGVDDISFEEQERGLKPRVPCVVEDLNEKNPKEVWKWCPEIDAETGVILNWEKGTKAKVYYKVCDECEIDYIVDGEKVCDNDDYWYCPKFLCPDEEGYGDYIIMRIDETGQIADWNPKDVEKWVKGQKK